MDVCWFCEAFSPRSEIFLFFFFFFFLFLGFIIWHQRDFSCIVALVVLQSEVDLKKPRQERKFILLKENSNKHAKALHGLKTLIVTLKLS